ncbi:hypothetical protein [Methylotuvimicrobium sp. KM1]|uniref:hypothetical protein n=1 Tax=Methylotuvimicrobium sp. KM1 TaxID=3377707 RepID=UPI00384D891F
MSIKNVTIGSVQESISAALSELTKSKVKVNIKSMDISGELTGEMFEEQTVNLSMSMVLNNIEERESENPFFRSKKPNE